ncbi:MAG: glycoside hydrolase, partial [Fibrella sp.]|nr:glycoside hydrolase [Armatimonadota bacterium]
MQTRDESGSLTGFLGSSRFAVKQRMVYDSTQKDAGDETRPWTRWWWLGSALSETEITSSLEKFRHAGFGGVEISPIYGVTGNEAQSVAFLSPRWVELFAFTVQEARRMHLGVDLIAGTGWPFGGPWVKEDDAAQQIWMEKRAVGGETRSSRKPSAKLLAEQESDGKRYALFLAPTGQQVKRAAPGGEGNVLNPFDADAVRRYFAAFDTAFAVLPDDLRPRCFFNDSWEVFGANTTPEILLEFSWRRGYDLQEHLQHFAGDGDPDTVRRVRSDYRETIHEITLQSFLEIFGDWARNGHGTAIRNQAHGSPGNLLDCYAAADIPETEVFGPARLTLGGLDRLRELPPDFGTEEEGLVCRMASSAAHVAGRPLCSSESFTWLGEHGHVTLEQMKAEVDTLFTLGINHLFFHGTPFSPEDAEWPGWLFYATTHCAPSNPFWRDLPALNAYITRCQSFLQAGRPGNDLLLYFPFYDLIAGEAGAHDLLQFLTVGRTATWLRGNLLEFTGAANRLVERGWTFDMVSDKQLIEQVHVAESGDLTAAHEGTYRALLIVGCRHMPPDTLGRIAALAKSGACILFADDLLTDVPGLSDLPGRRARLYQAQNSLSAAPGFARDNDLESLLTKAGVERETITDFGIEFIRRRTDTGWLYFLANPGTTNVSGWMPLTKAARTVTLHDPMRGGNGTGAVRVDGSGRTSVYLEIPAGSSLILDASGSVTRETDWRYTRPAGTACSLKDGWKVAFVAGGPILPSSRPLPALSDWTTWEADDSKSLRAFSGTARYTVSFET